MQILIWLIFSMGFVQAEWRWDVLTELPVANGEQIQPGVAGAFSGVHNDCLIVAGGANFPAAAPWDGGTKVYHDAVYAMVRKEGQVRWIPQSVKLPAKLAYGVTLSTEHGLICIGGESPDGEGHVLPQKEVFVLTWDAATEEVGVSRKLMAEGDDPEEILPLPNLSVPLANMAATRYNDQVFLLGGQTPEGYSDRMWYLRLNRRIRAKGTNPNAPNRLIWRDKPMFEQAKRSHCMALLQNDGIHDSLWLLSGRRKSAEGKWELLTDVHKYNLQTGTWLNMGDIRLPGEGVRCVMAGSAMPEGYGGIVIFGGADGGIFKKLEVDFPERIAAARAAGDQQHAESLMESKSGLLKKHPGFSKDILRYSALLDSWERVGSFPEGIPVTTSLVPWDGEVLLVSGEIRPGVRTANIWIGQHLE